MRKDVQTEMSKLIVAFRNYVNAPRKAYYNYMQWRDCEMVV